MKKKCLVVTGGGDCPGLNAVIRAIVKRADSEPDWEIWGSTDAYNGVLQQPWRLIKLDKKKVSGIHVQGGTILGTTNKGGPFGFPVKDVNGEIVLEDRSDLMIKELREAGFEAIISIGGDGSQTISQNLFEKGLNVVGVPKTIDNDLSCTDYTFGFSTAVDVATDAIDKLVTTAASHHRVLILEVMGRYAGWIALHSSLAAGAEICLIPEIPYDLEIVKNKIKERIERKGFLIMVVAEGAKPKDGEIFSKKSEEVGHEQKVLGGIGLQLEKLLRSDPTITADVRTSVLGHLQRGGRPSAFDRNLATQFGVKAFEMVLNKEFGKMVVVNHKKMESVSLKEAISTYNLVDKNSDMIKTARGVRICFGDE